MPDGGRLHERGNFLNPRCPAPFLRLPQSAAPWSSFHMATQAKPELCRQVFTISRELEYFTEAELVTQTGYRKDDWWPGVFVKEIVDNGLDACEQAGVAQEIRVIFSNGTLIVCWRH
jgi:hypothetical protein